MFMVVFVVGVGGCLCFFFVDFFFIGEVEIYYGFF